jgi:hypothetical protein
MSHEKQKPLPDQAEELARLSDRGSREWQERVADVLLVVFIAILSITAVYGLLARPIVP